MDELMEAYERFKGDLPMKMTVKWIPSGIPRWRIHILGIGMCSRGGCMELVCVEDKDKQRCIEKAIDCMAKRRVPEMAARTSKY